MVWKPGQCGNPNGRPRKYPQPPPGVNAKDFYGLAAYRDEYRNIAEAHGLEDPVLFQHKLLQDQSISVGLRATIAAAIAPYYRPKLGLQPPPRMVEIQVEVPEFKTVEEAEQIARAARQAKDQRAVAHGKRNWQRRQQKQKTGTVFSHISVRKNRTEKAKVPVRKNRTTGAVGKTVPLSISRDGDAELGTPE